MLLRAIRRHGGPRILYTHHWTLEFDEGLLAGLDGPYMAAHQLLARLADHVVVTSEAYADLFNGNGRSSGFGGAVGRRSGRFQPAAPSGYDGSEALRVLFVGQLRPYKGAAVAIEAVADQPDLALTIVGRGPEEASLRRRLLESGADNVRMTGYLDEEALVDAYRAHDVCVLPSTNRGEAFGLVLLEGMAAGCVPVASDLPGVRDLARSNGLLVAPGDAQDLRWALQRARRAPGRGPAPADRRNRGGRPALVGLRLRRVPRPRRATGAFVTEPPSAPRQWPSPARPVRRRELGDDRGAARASREGRLRGRDARASWHWRACSSRSRSTRR